MNHILFSVIGFLMFAIVGIGAAEVKIQMTDNSRLANREVEREEVGSVASEARAETDRESDASRNADSSTEAKVATEISTPPTTVPEALSQVVRTVSTALTSDWGDDSSSREDDEWEDEEEYEDGDEDEDEHRSKQTATAPKTTPTPPSAPAQNTQTQPITPSVTTFTMAQVASHNSAASCYTTVGGVVYDVTSYVSKHPGGQSAIKSICGVDGTAAFSGQHGGQGKPSSVLAQFKIGVVQ